MGLSKLENLYRQVILDHSTHPHNNGTLDDSSYHIEMNNPTCGDVIHLEVKTEGDVIKDIAFSGHGCSISTASASMMTDAVKGKTVDEALKMADDFSLMVQGEDVPDVDKLGDAEILSGVTKFPARVKCATLSWKALRKAVKESDQGVGEAGFMKH
ncbi:MAG TPA: SUF system NifU family Fe-S cluster assembly protein [Tetragenococcus sp.]|nr:SUF system NifU family Fe-S cluster assembly protein [Tetragenococcus sp.]